MADAAYVSASAVRLLAVRLLVAAVGARLVVPVAPLVLAPVFVSVSALAAELGLAVLRRWEYRIVHD